MSDPQDLPLGAGGSPGTASSREGATALREPLPSSDQRGIFQDHERLKNILAGIQSLLLCVAIIAGGGWTLYTFITEHQTTRSLLELDKIRKEAELQEGVAVEITAKQIISVTPNRFGLLVTVMIHNRGDIVVPIDLGGQCPEREEKEDRIEPLRITHMAPGDGELVGDRQYFPYAHNNYLPKGHPPCPDDHIDSIDLFPRTDRSLEYYQEVEEAGLYNISFYFQADPRVKQKVKEKELEALGKEFTSDSPGHWVGNHTFLEVKKLR